MSVKSVNFDQWMSPQMGRCCEFIEEESRPDRNAFRISNAGDQGAVGNTGAKINLND
jgi:hypothetical protein